MNSTTKTIKRLNLPTLLSKLPKNGLNSALFQSRWNSKLFPLPKFNSKTNLIELDGKCYWEIKKVDLKFNSENDKIMGKVFGVLYWKGKRVTPLDKPYEKISGGLKYNWSSSNLPPSCYVEEKVVESTV